VEVTASSAAASGALALVAASSDIASLLLMAAVSVSLAVSVTASLSAMAATVAVATFWESGCTGWQLTTPTANTSKNPTSTSRESIRMVLRFLYRSALLYDHWMTMVLGQKSDVLGKLGTAADEYSDYTLFQQRM
jgi:hypothetical protein